MYIQVDFSKKKSMSKIDGARFFMKNLKTVKIKPSDALFLLQLCLLFVSFLICMWLLYYWVIYLLLC